MTVAAHRVRILSATERAERHAYAIVLHEARQYRNTARRLACEDAEREDFTPTMREQLAKILNADADVMARAAKSLAFAIRLNAPQRVRHVGAR